MPNLGEQFNNTYFDGETEGNEVSNFKNTTPPNDGEQRKNAQGLLFHPSTGTQDRNDPLQSPGRRLASIGSTFPNLSNHAKLAINDNDMPLPMLMDNSPTVIELKEGQSKTAGGHYRSSTNTIHMRTTNWGVNLTDANRTFTHEMGHKVDTDVATARLKDAGHRPLSRGNQAGSTHSIGGAIETYGAQKGKYTVSPIMEGIADGFSDRYSPNVIQPEREPHESILDPSKDFVNSKVRLKRSGYNIENKYWKTQRDQAIYAATRLHVGMGGKNNIETLPNMDKLANDHLGSLYETLDEKKKSTSGTAVYRDSTFHRASRHLYLGALVTEQPHLHEALHKLGFGAVTEHARATYNDAVVRKANTDFESAKTRSRMPPGYSRDGPQEVLPGFTEPTQDAVNRLPKIKPMSEASISRAAIGKKAAKREQEMKYSQALGGKQINIFEM